MGAGEDRTARELGWVSGAGLFLFCRRPTAISQQAVLSEQVLALPHAFPQLSPRIIHFPLLFS